MATSGLNHFTILTDDVPGTVRFYSDLLGLHEGERPPLGFPGAWLYAGDQPVLHIVGGPRLQPAERVGAQGAAAINEPLVHARHFGDVDMSGREIAVGQLEAHQRRRVLRENGF